MAIVVLVRHGRTQANTDGILAGWSPGVHLDEVGTDQATRVGERLAPTPLVAVVSSPLERCQETAEAISAGQHTTDAGGAGQRGPVARHTDDRLGECRYGAWTGRALKDLAKEPLWADIQQRPSTVTFPPDDTWPAESLLAMRDRAVAAIGEWDARFEAEHGPGAVWAAVSHGDVIKALVAHALASPLDRFQRIVIDPASVSIVRHAPTHPFVLRVNDTGTSPVDLSALSRSLVEADAGSARDEGTVGGGAGSD